MILVCVGLALIAFAGCGSPDDGDSGFVFDPVPVVTNNLTTPVFVDHETCAVFSADQISATLLQEDLEAFREWATDLGFEIMEEHPSRGGDDVFTILRVPVGSVPAALEFVRAQPIVIAADANALSIYFPERTPTPIVPCTPAR